MPLDLALQGGGAHGAFTWGVLDRLLEDETIEITAVSGASAGAVNAAVLASGLATGGREGARDALRSFWESLNQASRESGPMIPLMEAFPLTFRAISAWWTSVFGNVALPSSPDMGAAAQRLLRDLLVEHIDFEALRSDKAAQLYVSATDARNGKFRIFRNDDISPDALLASACLPLFFPAVTIDGVEYWDGGYSANPPIMPLVSDSACDDLLLVTINPTFREDTPHTTSEISNRLNELAFNQTLVKDLRGLVMVQNEISPLNLGKGLLGKVKRLRLHEIHDEATLSAMPAQSKMTPLLEMLLLLHGKGRTAADTWLESDGKQLGKKGTAQLTERYLPD